MLSTTGVTSVLKMAARGLNCRVGLGTMQEFELPLREVHP